MSFLGLLFYFVVLVMIIVAIVLNVYASNATASLLIPLISNNSNVTTPQSINNLIITSYILLGIAGILLLINMIASGFMGTPLVSSDGYRYPMYMMILAIMLLIGSLVLNLIAYFQLYSNFASSATGLLTSSAVIFVSIFLLLIFAIYAAYNPAEILLVTPPVVEVPLDAPNAVPAMLPCNVPVTVTIPCATVPAATVVPLVTSPPLPPASPLKVGRMEEVQPTIAAAKEVVPLSRLQKKKSVTVQTTSPQCTLPSKTMMSPTTTAVAVTKNPLLF